MASSSSATHQEIKDYDAFAGIEPAHQRINSAASPRLYDVFINHRGPDVKPTLALHLYNSFTDLGLKAFLDSEEMELGEPFPSALQNAIWSSSVHIVIFSKRYAESAWCLAELTLILQTESKIIPVFYDVAPLDLRYAEKGVYADAFAKYKEKDRYLSKLDQWKESLHMVSFISGYEFSQLNEEKLCKTLASAVQLEVEKTNLLDVAKNPVGLNELVEDFKKWYDKDLKENCQIVGIYGMGGSGKTTLAKELFNRNRSGYKASCFLFDVREKSARTKLPSLQTKLLKDLFGENHPKFGSKQDGTSYLKNRFKKMPPSCTFFIIVDDIDHVEQLEALSVMDMLNRDSLVIVTTRDESVLKKAGIKNRYKVKKMNPEHSRQLFCWHAFGQPDPIAGYEVLVEKFIKRCGGLPLSLQVLGGHVFDREDKQFWKLTLDKVTKTLPADIKKILRISFDALDADQQQIFMDIACFFVEKERSMAIRIWEGSGWRAEHSLQMLKEKCLVEEENRDYKLTLTMHDLLRDLGRDIADELNRPPRLWNPHSQDLRSLESKGFKKILTTTNGRSFRCLNSIFDRSIGSQITYFLGNRDDCAETSTVLLWLELDLNWHLYTSIPSWIPLQHLQFLKVERGRLKRLWQINSQTTFQLKNLALSDTASLGEFPNTLAMLNHLEHLVLEGSSAYWIGKSGRQFGMFNCLKNLFLGGRSWRQLEIQGEALSKSLIKLTELRSLILRDFLISGELDLNGSGSESTILEPLRGSCMRNLETIEMYDVKLTSKVSISGKHCPRLECLHLESMECLIELSTTLLTTMNSLQLKDCKKLKRVSGEFDLAKLVILECPKLEQMPSLENSRFLESITVDRCENLRSIRGIDKSATLKSLHFSSSPGLIHNSFCNRTELPSEFTSIIGRAAVDAESNLNEGLFSEFVSSDALHEFKINKKGMPGAALKTADSLSAIVICAVIISSEGDVRMELPYDEYICRSVGQGKWVWTIVIADPTEINHAQHYMSEWVPIKEYPGLNRGIQKGYMITFNNGEEWKIRQMLSEIIGGLYESYWDFQNRQIPVARRAQGGGNTVFVHGRRDRNKVLKSILWGGGGA